MSRPPGNSAETDRSAVARFRQAHYELVLRDVQQKRPLAARGIGPNRRRRELNGSSKPGRRKL